MKGSDTSFQLLACRYVQKQTKTLLTHIDGIRRGDDIESIHQARVASRRICAALGVFKAAFPAKKVRRWSKHIRRLIKGLGAARDKDVQIEFVAGMVTERTPAKRADLPGLKRLLLRLRQQREAIQPRVIKTLDRLDATEILSEMPAYISKLTTRLQKAGTDSRSPFVLEQGARDIRRTCNKLLKLQSCLEDAGAIEQHHRMRIAAKKLRYTMEIYKKAFDKQLDETIKVIRDVQTLLGDIHDCDVWCELIQTYTHEERRQTVEYYGHARSFHRLRPGFEYLKNERVTLRRDKFNELATLWKVLQSNRFWEELTTYLKAPHTGSCSRALNDAIIRTGRPASAITNASESRDSEESSLVRPSSSQAELPEILNEREERSSWPVPESDKEESQTGPSTEEEIDGETSSVNAELIGVFELPSQDEPPLPADNPSEPDRPAVSHAPLVENAICECCSQNSFPQDELRRIDSGQLLCPGCLGEFHEKVSRSARQ